MPSHIVAFHVRICRDIGAIHEAGIVRYDVVVSRIPSIIRIVVRVELKSEEMDVPIAIENLVGSSKLALDMIVIILVVAGTGATC